MIQVLAYAAYAVGSGVFLGVALSRGSTVVAVGSVLFLIGTLLLLVPEVRRRLAAPAPSLRYERGGAMADQAGGSAPDEQRRPRRRRRAVGPPGARPSQEPDLALRDPAPEPPPDDDQRLLREVPPHHG